MSINTTIWQKYLEGTASPEELEQLYAWLQAGSHPELEALFRKDMEGSEELSAAAAHRLTTALRQQILMKAAPAPRRIQWKKWTAAAAVLLCAMAGYYFFNNSNRKAAIATILYDSVVNNGATPRIVHLPDQSKVWLNRHAILYISKNYTQQRQLRLSGEGYFDVVKDPSHPFTVQTGQLITTVLGTAFNIEQSAGHEVRVSLVSGKVRIGYATDTSTLVLLPGEMAVANQQQQALQRTSISVTDVAAWIKGDLVFNQLPLSEALQKWAAFYGKSIAMKTTIIEGLYVTGTYRRTQGWEEVLKHLLFIHQLKYTVQQNSILITKP